jgi:hypothetical protein
VKKSLIFETEFTGQDENPGPIFLKLKLGDTMRNLNNYILQDPTTGSYVFITRNLQKPVEFDAEHFGKRNKVLYKKNTRNKKNQTVGDISNAKN